MRMWIMENSDFLEKNQKKEDKRKSLPHLFKKGQSGNPAGKPPGTISIISELKKKLKEKPPGEKRTYLEAFIMKILKKALYDEDVKMMIEIMRYIDGMPRQQIEMKGDINMSMTKEEIINNIVAILNEYENK